MSSSSLSTIFLKQEFFRNLYPKQVSTSSAETQGLAFARKRPPVHSTVKSQGIHALTILVLLPNRSLGQALSGLERRLSS